MKKIGRWNQKFDFSKDVVTVEEKMEVVNKTLSVPFYHLEDFITFIQELVPKIPISTFKKSLSEQYYDFEDFDIAVCDDIANNNLDALFENPTLELEELQQALPNIIPPELVRPLISKVQDIYPLQPHQLIAELQDDVRASFAAIATLIRSNNRNDSFLLWLAHNLIRPDWHQCTGNDDKEIAKCGVFKKFGAFSSDTLYWALLSPNNNFQLINPEGQVEMNFKATTIDKSHSGNSLRVWRDSENIGIRLVKVFDELVDHWTTDDTQLAVFLPYSNGCPPPAVVVDAFRRLLLAEDTVVLRALFHHELFPVDVVGQQMIDSLFKIFSSKNLVHRFICTVVSSEFSHPGDLTETMVLRGNSHLTCLFKYFASKFAKDYYERVIKPVTDEVVSQGNVGIIKPEDENEWPEKQEKVAKLLNSVLDKLLSSGPYIPAQFHHLASILKICTAVVLRSKHAVYNALSSFMYLRFFTPAIVTPGNVIKDARPVPEFKTTTLPFSQLVQLPLNFQQFSMPKYEHLKKLNEDIMNRYAEIYNFTMEIAEYDRQAAYEQATDKEAFDATLWIVEHIAKSNSKKEFFKRVNEFREKEDEKTSVSFMLAAILANCFK
ncbi:GTPase-activator protein, putative [Trichomonas vaginalis G3]|uniref:GTPase-activator protein, putative n=1 Tax=Trichomonas vaginalis (strain ATCC PRA-98 / G3) TaxID=412133 RepID=A2G2R5_TRIV3|nr:Rasgap domain-containing protein [Trichomonas vaginalis G3]EAX88543.1 GTPase-activator protein, putative [Trichomonas vaginalis G3]KAI5521693.1 Rasgap domain-containing protein [Trichomonas vaginalis G3]|eukprot:XP_001301473.1 GTPase-activator protein [Trichomonas vaginalis G3]